VIIKTPTQFLANFRGMVRGWIYEVLREEEIYNSSMWSFGVVKVNADGKHADCYINAASTVTANVPITPHVGTLVVNDKVLILNRSGMRDLIILSKTLQ
jgi:hypothetical protein